MQGSTPKGVGANTSFITKEHREAISKKMEETERKHKEESKDLVKESSDVLKEKIDLSPDQAIEKAKEETLKLNRINYFDSVKEEFGLELTEDDIEDLIFKGSIQKEMIVLRDKLSIILKSSNNVMTINVLKDLEKYDRENPDALAQARGNREAILWLTEQVVSLKKIKSGETTSLKKDKAFDHLSNFSTAIIERMDACRKTFESAIRVKMGDMNELKK